MRLTRLRAAAHPLLAATALCVLLLAGCSGSETSFEGIRRYPVGSLESTQVHKISRWAGSFRLGETVRASVTLPRSARVSVPWALRSECSSARIEIDLVEGNDRHPVLRRELTPQQARKWNVEILNLTESRRGPVEIEIRVDAEDASGEPEQPVAISPIEVWSEAAASIPDTLPDVILLAIDTLRADHLSTYGGVRPTPNIDALAASGTLFESAFSPSTWTVPSFASVITSTYPQRHQMGTYRRMPGNLSTLGEVFARQGYRTLGMYDGGHFGPRLGFSRGFDLFIKGEGTRDFGRRLTRGLRTPGHAPLLLLFHTYDVHQPYYSIPRKYRKLYTDPGHRSPLNLRSRRVPSRKGRATVELTEGDLELVRSLYDGQIRHLDDSLPAILDLLDSHRPGRPRLVVLFSDHGESFGEGRRLLHSGGPHRELSHIPLIFAGDGIPSGERVTEIVETLGLLPTLIELLGFPDEETKRFDGASFAELLRPEARTAPMRPYAIAQRGRGWALRSDDWSLVSDLGTLHLYDRREDPWETVDVAGPNPDIVARLSTVYQDLMADTQPETSEEVPVDEETLKELKALGYLDD